MKKNLRTIMVAVFLGITATSANQSFAANNLPLRSDLTKNEELTSFIKTKAAKFSKANLENFRKYNEVVDLYSNSSIAFYNLNDSQKSEFENATNALIKSLNELNNPEAASWANKVKLNQMVFGFIWNSKTTNPVNPADFIAAQ